MYCTNCGNKIEDNAKFCTNCGKKVEDSTITKSNSTGETTSNKNKKTSTIVIIIISIVIILLILLVLFSIYVSKNITKEMTKELQRQQEQIKKQKTNMSLSFALPSEFKKTLDTSTYLRYIYQDNNAYCTIRMQNVSNYMYKTPEEYLESYSYYSSRDDVSDIQTKTINKVTWKFLEVESEYSNKFYYATDYSNRMYLIEYNIIKDEKGYCKNVYYKFIESLKFVNNKDSNSNNKKDKKDANTI